MIFLQLFHLPDLEDGRGRLPASLFAKGTIAEFDHDGAVSLILLIPGFWRTEAYSIRCVKYDDVIFGVDCYI